MGLWDQRKLIHLAILKLLVLDVGPDCLLVTPNRRNEIPACPELMPGKIFRFSFDILRDPNRSRSPRQPSISAGSRPACGHDRPSDGLPRSGIPAAGPSRETQRRGSS